MGDAVREGYDATVGHAVHPDVEYMAYALVKFNYRITTGQAEPIEAEPLLHDFNDEEAEPRLHPGTDFWPFKNFTDFVVQGSAFAPNGQPVPSMGVNAAVGSFSKTIQVFGRREVRWGDGPTPMIGAPEPFEEIPLVYENAYGGLDWRVPVGNLNDPMVQLELMHDHPGMYPRNPMGKGYLVVEGEVDDMEMPNLEDPQDMLTAERLITGDPALWYRQPMPWCFDWSHPATFPRHLFLGNEVDAWFPGPQDHEMPEVARQLLAPGYRDLLASRDVTTGPDPSFFQGGSLGLVLPRFNPGELVSLTGMHPERYEMRFQLPVRMPEIVLIVEGRPSQVIPVIHHVVCHPAEERVTVLYAVSLRMDRIFIDGVHKHIPIQVQVDGDAPIAFDPEKPVLEVLAEGDPDGEAAKLFPTSPIAGRDQNKP